MRILIQCVGLGLAYLIRNLSSRRPSCANALCISSSIAFYVTQWDGVASGRIDASDSLPLRDFRGRDTVTRSPPTMRKRAHHNTPPTFGSFFGRFFFQFILTSVRRILSTLTFKHSQPLLAYYGISISSKKQLRVIERGRCLQKSVSLATKKS